MGMARILSKKDREMLWEIARKYGSGPIVMESDFIKLIKKDYKYIINCKKVR